MSGIPTPISLSRPISRVPSYEDLPPVEGVVEIELANVVVEPGLGAEILEGEAAENADIHIAYIEQKHNFEKDAPQLKVCILLLYTHSSLLVLYLDMYITSYTLHPRMNPTFLSPFSLKLYPFLCFYLLVLSPHYHFPTTP